MRKSQSWNRKVWSRRGYPAWLTLPRSGKRPQLSPQQDVVLRGRSPVAGTQGPSAQRTHSNIFSENLLAAKTAQRAETQRMRVGTRMPGLYHPGQGGRGGVVSALESHSTEEAEAGMGLGSGGPVSRSCLHPQVAV